MWSNDIKCKYMFMFPLKKLVRKDLIQERCISKCFLLAWTMDRPPWHCLSCSLASNEVINSMIPGELPIYGHVWFSNGFYGWIYWMLSAKLSFSLIQINNHLDDFVGIETVDGFHVINRNHDSGAWAFVGDHQSQYSIGASVTDHQWPLLLTWFNFNPSMYK